MHRINRDTTIIKIHFKSGITKDKRLNCYKKEVLTNYLFKCACCEELSEWSARYITINQFRIMNRLGLLLCCICYCEETEPQQKKVKWLNAWLSDE